MQCTFLFLFQLNPGNVHSILMIPSNNWIINSIIKCVKRKNLRLIYIFIHFQCYSNKYSTIEFFERYQIRRDLQLNSIHQNHVYVSFNVITRITTTKKRPMILQWIDRCSRFECYWHDVWHLNFWTFINRSKERKKNVIMKKLIMPVMLIAFAGMLKVRLLDPMIDTCLP